MGEGVGGLNEVVVGVGMGVVGGSMWWGGGVEGVSMKWWWCAVVLVVVCVGIRDA